MLSKASSNILCTYEKLRGLLKRFLLKLKIDILIT